MNMKKLLWIALAFMGLCLTVVSCSEKDESPFPPIENPDNIGAIEVGWVEEGNTVKFTVSQSYGYLSYVVTYTCTFNSNGGCTMAIARYEFSSVEIADMFYESYRQEYEDVSKSGKVVTIDETEDFEGLTKEQLRGIYESMANL